MKRLVLFRVLVLDNDTILVHSRSHRHGNCRWIFSAYRDLELSPLINILHAYMIIDPGPAPGQRTGRGCTGDTTLVRYVRTFL